MITLDEIRERYLEFFKKRGHTVYPSDSLVPPNDPSLLFTGAGMNQFKDMFLGRGTLPFKRATTSQKCLRTGDLEAVGRTSRHHTFFEMLGNFSFGDYFKREAITWAWEFATKEMGIAPDRLTISVYKDDPEAYRIWNEEVGIPAARLARLGEGDNFWPANAPSQGPNGPCGPCSEIYYDYGPKYGCGSPDCSITCGCNRYVEIWNLVFTQFDRQDGGVLQPLPQKNIDTGAGLERWASVLQGVHSNFETDVFLAIIGAEAQILGLTYSPGTEQSSRMRRIADHVRALTFCIADNALPGNTGRNYVVRRILRTALRDGVQLGHGQAFLHRLVPAVVAVMKKGYPYLLERQKTIEQVIKVEEEKFLDTLEKGNELITEAIARLRRENKDTLSGDEAFKLYDTFGFPIEMTEQILRDHQMKLDRQRFEQIIEGRSEGDRTAVDIFEKGPFSTIKEQKVPTSQFLGYGVPVGEISKPQEATVLRIIKIGDRKKYNESKKDVTAFTSLLNAKTSTLVDSAAPGTEVAVLLDRTPLYGEGGGQAGDAGSITGEATVALEDCRKPDGYYFHLGKVTRGTLKQGAKVKVAVDAERRLNIMRNHTGTHLLQAALRSVLGAHVQQAGSVVEADRLRFDFSHFQALTPEEIRKVEDWVNGVVFADVEVTKTEMTMDEAKSKGAIAFFGEKYGDRVRVVTVGPGLSVELCGGTHLEHSATIGAFRITSESSIGSGIRRIEAVTGPKVVEMTRAQEDTLNELSRLLKSPRQEVPKKVQKLLEEIQKLKSTRGQDPGSGAYVEFKRDPNSNWIMYRIDAGDVDAARSKMDELIKKQNFGSAIIAVGSEKPAFVIGVREDLVKAKGIKAGDLAKEIGKATGGGGGGRETQAQAGASDASKIPLGFETFERLIRAKLS
ncbi:MAG TPA: alanine--tRNA ligase [Planctomycetota bacterium]|nr:alanine--tRNA ligase [Planctomycetota bacterium]